MHSPRCTACNAQRHCYISNKSWMKDIVLCSWCIKDIVAFMYDNNLMIDCAIVRELLSCDQFQYYPDVDTYLIWVWTGETNYAPGFGLYRKKTPQKIKLDN